VLPLYSSLVRPFRQRLQIRLRSDSHAGLSTPLRTDRMGSRRWTPLLLRSRSYTRYALLLNTAFTDKRLPRESTGEPDGRDLKEAVRHRYPVGNSGSDGISPINRWGSGLRASGRRLSVCWVAFCVPERAGIRAHLKSTGKAIPATAVACRLNQSEHGDPYCSWTRSCREMANWDDLGSGEDAAAEFSNRSPRLQTEICQVSHGQVMLSTNPVPACVDHGQPWSVAMQDTLISSSSRRSLMSSRVHLCFSNCHPSSSIISLACR